MSDVSLENVFIELIHKISPAELEGTISVLNEDRIQTAIRYFNKENDPKWKQKIRAAILGLNRRPQLEAAGKGLCLEQLVELLESALQIEDKHHWKLSPLLVGLRFEVFRDFLLQASDRQLVLLKHEGVTEPVQHSLTLLTHELSNQIKAIEKELDQFDEMLEGLDIQLLSSEDVSELLHRIELYTEYFENNCQIASKALAIAWNTSRLDLIESLNKIKENCQKYNRYGVGLPSSIGKPATGLYKKLENKLYSIFGDPNDVEKRDALQDNEPVMEALVKFGIWYLRDYLELGLIKSVKDVSELDAQSSFKSEEGRVSHRERLFAEARSSLEKIGLLTVGDLKRNYIFSKRTLREFLFSIL